MVFSCGEHEHRRLGGGHLDEYKEIKEHNANKLTPPQPLPQSSQTPTKQNLKQQINFLPPGRYSLPSQIPTSSSSSSSKLVASAINAAAASVIVARQHKANIPNGSSLMSTSSSSSSSSSSSGSATPPPGPLESASLNNKPAQQHHRSYQAGLGGDQVEGEEEDEMMGRRCDGDGESHDEMDENMLQIDEKRQQHQLDHDDQIGEEEPNRHHYMFSDKQQSVTPRNSVDHDERVNEEDEDEEVEYNGGGGEEQTDEQRDDVVNENVDEEENEKVGDECNENQHTPQPVQLGSVASGSSLSSLHGSNSSSNCLTESTNKILNRQQVRLILFFKN